MGGFFYYSFLEGYNCTNFEAWKKLQEYSEFEL